MHLFFASLCWSALCPNFQPKNGGPKVRTHFAGDSRVSFPLGRLVIQHNDPGGVRLAVHQLQVDTLLNVGEEGQALAKH